MTSPIFDTLAAEREATPVFRSLASSRDVRHRPFDATRRSPTATATATAKTSTTSAGANATAIRDAVSAVATWPLRAVPC
ncbi:hypothetical protein IFT36_10330 [Frigoribacterium sp. CFBP 13605]|uniref:hypothetical protein n=1 Tax=Frigoribacterium sp. CFBP 13605 TaxID=2774034 RepID=UPI001907C3D4|nr:hypothetical protein [Frigoribacterium sp. CFBP 13605]MBD8140936.1 hypothetical protein [Frigoribacterium sp. CFBP 13605]